MPLGVVANIGALPRSSNNFYALNSTELGLCYSVYFPHENSNCLVQQ